ncbi:uncharacterized protein LOC123300895 [Chrysoperla carnea]|uniref:uncharacterized protein LOC123300895 n=1 Tax=Chrysoperla carnea TaxID=189513 RepID=UPI001D066B14|nr:uncharacterized protein LOC123300895 [Chrysoperla carnea]
MKELVFFILSSLIVLSKSLFIPNGQPDTLLNVNSPSKLSQFISPLTNGGDLDTAESLFRNTYSGWRYGSSNSYGNYIPGSYTQYGIPIGQSSLNLPSVNDWNSYGSWPGSYGGGDTGGYARPGWRG